TATNPTGAFLPNVKVTLRNENTGESRSQPTIDLGSFAFPHHSHSGPIARRLFKTVTSSGHPVTIYDSLSTNADPDKPGSYISYAFMNNVIPSNLIDAISPKVAPLYPPPNSVSNPLTGANKFFGSAAVPNTQDHS